ncbi:S-adenosylmethionine mitochondrial carrier protein-like isoform X2 [Cephus cinctus]|uniref:S-adenosylmethionine mitochondrial carrier protein-like isoform X2 n=1 Tax=Cephus cinctus TaxID=211228 RepID=A0AAJ7RDK4_CEPCN|nr:S-adenosylmethionine mitochondrial carrier protein-like isoform X2 [Cephus cinctus]
MGMFHEQTTGPMAEQARNILLSSLISGGVAGMVCDLLLFPLDTLKTRLQSQHGFTESGGFKKLYRGVAPVMIGSAPSEILQPLTPPQYHAIVHAGAASVGELVACSIRVPMEVIKQRKQALLTDTARMGLRMLYRGYGSTVLRDLPFTLVQMPLWEYLKLYWKRHVSHECTPLAGAICGAASVTISAAVTTPLDVAKTRIMLSCSSLMKDEIKISTMLKEVYREAGFKGLFAGFSLRVSGFTLGGFLFFGSNNEIFWVLLIIRKILLLISLCCLGSIQNPVRFLEIVPL